MVDTITAGGKFDAPAVQRVFWCSAEGLVAIALLLGGGPESDASRPRLQPGFRLPLSLLAWGFPCG